MQDVSCNLKQKVVKNIRIYHEAIGRIIGTQTLNLIVKENLEVTGGILARAEIDVSGNLIDKGDANIEAAANSFILCRNANEQQYKKYDSNGKYS